MIRNAYFNWFEDECFFSLCSRQHEFWVNRSPQETLRLLFGIDIQSYGHDFPTYLDKLNSDAVAAWGSSEEIINQHTIAPMFFPFQSTGHVHDHKAAMKGNGLGSIKYKLGLITGRFGSAHPLKACSACMLDDRCRHGVAYWHLTHQLPGVTTCSIHTCLLRESNTNRQWSRAFGWTLPSEKILINAETVTLSYSAFEALKALSAQAAELAESGFTVQFEPSQVSQVYYAAIVLKAPRHDKSIVAADFKHHCMKLRAYPLFSSLPCSNEGALGFISQMTRAPRGHSHPLKHLVFISWLFGSFKSFLEAYQEHAVDDITKNAEEPATLSLGQKGAERKSVNPHLIFKPKKMFVEVKKKVLASLAGGASKKQVCEIFGISISTVNRILRLNPVVAKKISDTASINFNLLKRENWRTVASDNPELGIMELRKMMPDVYAWLYRNDMTWLKMQNAKLPTVRRGNNSVINWDARDEDLCARLTKIITGHNVTSKTLRKFVVYEMVPGLYSALESKSHYPKTRKLLAELTKSRQDEDVCSPSPILMRKN